MTKKYFSCLLLCFSVLFVAAQSTMYVRLKSGKVKEYPLENIDSLSFRRPAKIAEPLVTDIDNNVYHTVTIGNQVWMVENLQTTHFRNGDLISTTSSSSTDVSGETEPTYQWSYNGNEADVNHFGRYYTWYAVSDARQLAPEGWHVATASDKYTLMHYLIYNDYYLNGITDGSRVAKCLASSNDWASSTVVNSPGNKSQTNNESGFNAIPAGYRTQNGVFVDQHLYAKWWLNTPINQSIANFTVLGYNYSTIPVGFELIRSGMPVRCVKDVEASTLPEVATYFTDLKPFSVCVSCNVTSDGGGTLKEIGYCWSTEADPTIESKKVLMRGIDVGYITDTLKNLPNNKTFFIRAYAVNSQGIAYGNEIAVTTPDTTKDWRNFASGTFVSSFFEESSTKVLQHSKPLNRYRLIDLYATGYNMEFEWDGGSKVTVLGSIYKPGVTSYKPAVETGYIDSTYGMIWAIFNGANTYDDATKVFTFPITWRVTAGNFGTYTDTYTITQFF